MTSYNCSVTREMLETIAQYHGSGTAPHMALQKPQAFSMNHLTSPWAAATPGWLCISVSDVLLGGLTLLSLA